MLVEQLADFLVAQGFLTESLGVVSGEGRVFEHAGDVHQHEQFVLLPCSLHGLPGSAQVNSGPVTAPELGAVAGEDWAGRL